jgi:hypothetical protein
VAEQLPIQTEQLSVINFNSSNLCDIEYDGFQIYYPNADKIYAFQCFFNYSRIQNLEILQKRQHTRYYTLSTFYNLLTITSHQRL